MIKTEMDVTCYKMTSDTDVSIKNEETLKSIDFIFDHFLIIDDMFENVNVIDSNGVEIEFDFENCILLLSNNLDNSFTEEELAFLENSKEGEFQKFENVTITYTV